MIALNYYNKMIIFISRTCLPLSSVSREYLFENGLKKHITYINKISPETNFALINFYFDIEIISFLTQNGNNN